MNKIISYKFCIFVVLWKIFLLELLLVIIWYWNTVLLLVFSVSQNMSISPQRDMWNGSHIFVLVALVHISGPFSHQVVKILDISMHFCSLNHLIETTMFIIVLLWFWSIMYVIKFSFNFIFIKRIFYEDRLDPSFPSFFM